MTNASQAISSKAISESCYPETFQVSFGRKRYELLYRANRKNLQSTLQAVELQYGQIRDSSSWDYERFLSLLEAAVENNGRGISYASVQGVFHEFAISGYLKSQSERFSERDCEILSVIADAKRRKMAVNIRSNNKGLLYFGQQYDSGEIREVGRTAIALATGGAALGTLLVGIPGAIIGGLLGVLVTFSEDRKKRTRGD